MAELITIKSVRFQLQDFDDGTNVTSDDVDFSDDDIMEGIKMAVRRYNDIPPHVHYLSARAVPERHQFIYDLIVACLFSLRARFLQRQEVEYTDGGVTTSPLRTRIAFLKGEAERLEARALPLIVDYKVAVNISQAYGQIG
jgi:hypothetical protein